MIIENHIHAMELNSKRKINKSRLLGIHNKPTISFLVSNLYANAHTTKQQSSFQ